jgi:hypothetical protein
VWRGALKIENSNKRRKVAEWLNKTGNGQRRRVSPVTQRAREYMHYKPYGGIYVKGDNCVPGRDKADKQG